MLDPKIETAIRDAVDAGFADQTAFTAEIVASPSVRGREQPAQNLMAAAMRQRGFGEYLLREALKEAANTGRSLVYTVDAENAASLALARKAGLQQFMQLARFLRKGSR